LLVSWHYFIAKFMWAIWQHFIAKHSLAIWQQPNCLILAGNFGNLSSFKQKQ
jgi:hypothetical protein